ncbi:hypothetical protein VTH06DRAFT_2579 [Thermothelomyces fergusii]
MPLLLRQPWFHGLDKVCFFVFDLMPWERKPSSAKTGGICTGNGSSVRKVGLLDGMWSHLDDFFFTVKTRKGVPPARRRYKTGGDTAREAFTRSIWLPLQDTDT